MQKQTGVINTIKHPAVVQTRKELGKSGSGTKEFFPADGFSLVSRALSASAPIRRIFFITPVVEPEYDDLLSAAWAAGIECHLVSKGVFFKLLGLGYETSAKVLAVIRTEQPPPSRLLDDLRKGRCLMIGERVQDPRNIGVLIRTADAAGMAAAAFTEDSAPLYSRESVRSSTGSIFRLPVSTIESLPDFLREARAAGARIIGTSARTRLPYWKADFTGPCVIVLGNESDGMSPETAACCDPSIQIPIQGGASSYNVTVAAGVILCEAARQRMADS